MRPAYPSVLANSTPMVVTRDMRRRRALSKTTKKTQTQETHEIAPLWTPRKSGQRMQPSTQLKRLSQQRAASTLSPLFDLQMVLSETTGASGGSVDGGQTTSSAKASRGKRAVSSAAAKAPKKTARTTSAAARRGRAQQSQADTTRAPQQPTGHNTQQATAAKPSTRSTNFEGGLKKWTPCPDKVTRLLLPSHTSTHTLSHSHPPTHTLSQV
jgi:hypothetical protein